MKAIFYWILLKLDSIIYNFINYAYDIFLALSRATIISEETITPFIDRVYTIIGVVMLFLLAYSLLKSIVNPDNSGKESIGKVVFNIVKAIIILAVVPSVFDFAYTVQNSILEQNTIGKIILGNSTSEKNPSQIIEDGGVELSKTVLQAFIFPKDNLDASTIVLEEAGVSLADIWESISTNRSFSYITLMNEELALDNDKSEIDYQIFISTIAGCYVLYLFISYCLSLGLRVIKLAFYEIIAPIPVIASILPSKKDMLNKWVSLTITTFLEVFIRIAVLYLAVYLASLITTVLNDTGSFLATIDNNVIKGLTTACIIMGLFSFMKQAPQLISEITGIDSGKMSTGIREQLKNGGLFALGGMAGAAATSLARRGVSAIKTGRKNWKDNKKNLLDKNLSKKERAKAAFRMAGNVVSTAGGMTFGAAGSAIRGGFKGFNKDASSFGDIRDNAHKGAAAEDERLSKKYKYRASHGGFVKSIGGHFGDAARSIGDWSGISSVDAFVDENELLQQISDAKSKVKDGALKLADKEASKADSSFTLGMNAQIKWRDSSGNLQDATMELSASNLRRLQLDMEQAKATGAPNYSELANKYAAFRATMGDEIQNIAFKNENDWAGVDPSLQAKIGAINSDAETYRNLLLKNIANETVAQAGYTVENVKESFNVNSGATKAIGDEIDIKMAKNNKKINKFHEKRSGDSKDK